jgi:hypothetical protein
MKLKFLFSLLVLTLFTACQSKQAAKLELARSTESAVEVVITLTRVKGQVYLSATFTPTENKLHLYSKDIPKDGVGGLGRPALLELASGSSIKANGNLTESATAQILQTGTQELPVYPAGAVTLSLPVTLPAGKDWVNEQVIVTYMACTDYSCRAPVENKVIPIRIPQNEAFN